MKIAKPFLRDGVVLQPGDPLPAGVDDETVKHYLRHGMVARDSDQPAAPQAQQTGRGAGQQRQASNARTPRPSNTPAAAPAQTPLAGPSIAVTLTPTTTKDAATEAAQPSDPGNPPGADKPPSSDGAGASGTSETINP